MITMTLLAVLIKNNYALIMDADRNPLWKLPDAQRFQIMIYLSIMWTGIFSAAFGLWFWYGQLFVAHILMLLGFVLTSMTFSRFGDSSAVKAKVGR